MMVRILFFQAMATLAWAGTVDLALSMPPPPGKPWEPAWGFWPKAPPDSWQQTHWGFVGKAKQGPVDVLFLGDSLTKGWGGLGKEIWTKHYQPLHALNIGIGGDTTRQTLWRLQHEAMDGLEPKVVVLMIGVNNIFTGTGSDEEIVRGIQEILKEIKTRSPRSKILLFGLLPLGNISQNERTKNINSLLVQSNPPNVRYVDMREFFELPGGGVVPELYKPDQVHLEETGYQKWDGVLRPLLEFMLSSEGKNE